MKGRKRKAAARFISLLLSAVLISVLLPVSVFAEDSKFGETIAWTGGRDNVTVTGYGEMWDFDVNGMHVESTVEYYTPRVHHDWYYGDDDYTVGFSTQTEKITNIGNYVFSGYDSGRYITGNVVIPAAVTKIGDYAFWFNHITSLNLNRKLREIGDYAFAENDCLSSLVLNKGLSKIGDDAFSNNTALTGDLTIPASVTEIGERAFKGCSSFTGRLLFEEGSELEDIPEECFRNTGFDGILSLPDGLLTIGTNAFTNCRIERIYIPKTVTFIDATAFDKCPFIKKIYYGGTSGEWDAVCGNVAGFSGIPVQYNSKIEFFRVNFDSNGGSYVGSQVVVEGDPLAEPETSRSGYTFNGWYDENGRKWDFDSDTVTRDMTLTAEWTETAPDTPEPESPADGTDPEPSDGDNIKQYTVVFEPQNGEEAIKAAVSAGKYAVLPEQPVRKDYYFGGWYTRENGYGKLFTDYTAVESDMTVYASWYDEKGKVGYKKLVAKQKYDVSDFLSLQNKGKDSKFITSSKRIVSVSSKGIAKAKKQGSAFITGQYSSGKTNNWITVSNSMEIEVEKPAVTKKYTATSLGTISGNELYQGTDIQPSSFESSKPGVASVDNRTGSINILSPGSTKISIIWGEGKNAAKYKVTLKVPKGLSKGQD